MERGHVDERGPRTQVETATLATGNPSILACAKEERLSTEEGLEME